MSGKRYYITTPIYYVNARPHIGTALTTLAADVTARYKKMRGFDVMFLTGTDENAPKVAEAAEKAGQATQQFVDEVAQEFQTIWQGLGIRYDDFIRTTEERHKRVVAEVFRRLQAKGDIYTDDYEGWYCVSCETFWRATEVEEGLCPNPECRRAVSWVTESNYFFRLSAYADRIKDYILAHPDFIRPEARRNEVLRFIESGLRDACITRANSGWGVPVPGDESKVVYVWFDALINYLSATGWPDAWDENKTSDLWPPDVQWMGKDILVRFHATLWPAMLMSLGLPLPQVLVGHGWMMIGGEKISKSKGNTVEPVQLARELAERAGCTQELAVDAVRHYMAREMPFASDALFTMESFDTRYNTELANDLGNAVHRSVSMTHRYLDGQVPDAAADPTFVKAAMERVKEYEQAMDAFLLDKGVEATFGLVSQLNRYIDEMAPWSLAKNGDAVALRAVMRTMLESCRVIAALCEPVMPSAAAHIRSQIGYAEAAGWNETQRFDLLQPGTKLPEPRPAFPRLQTKEPVQAPEAQSKPALAEISIEEFAKVELRVADIVTCEKVEGSDKLLKMTVRVGEEERSLVAGIAEAYAPTDLVGKQIVIVANLKPAKVRGVLSQGMLLAADGETGPVLLAPSAPTPSGAKVH